MRTWPDGRWTRGPRGSRALIVVVCVLAYISLPAGVHAHADTADGAAVTEQDVTFESGGVQLSGTILIPQAAEGADGVPGLVLIHGAGPHLRDSLRMEAEAFANLGVATLIHDKRVDGYTQFERSYDLLADDALAAVATLRDHPDVDAGAVGLWGLSEGGWVAPLAAAQSDDVAFVVTVGASGVSPLEQTSWAAENNLAERGVEGSLRRMVTTTSYRFLRGAELFSEADFDPVVALDQLNVPLLGVWGDQERIAPPTESARIAADVLDDADDTHLSLRLFPGAGHALNPVTDGVPDRDALAPDFPETVTSWVHAVASGESLVETRDDFGEQDRESRPLAPLAWWESIWVQLGAMAIPLAGFVGYPVVRGVGVLRRRFSRRGNPGEGSHTASSAQALPVAAGMAAAGLVTLLGFHTYWAALIFTEGAAVGPMIGSRPLIWLMLQLLAVVTVGLAGLLALRTGTAGPGRGWPVSPRVVVMLGSGVVFVAWAVYWGLLVP